VKLFVYILVEERVAFWFMDTWRAMRPMICLEIRVGHVEYVRSVGFEVMLTGMRKVLWHL